jgi:hypothetical protein
MRTTLDLPDELFRQVKAKAALEGAKLKDLLTRYVENGLRQPAPARPAGRSKLPVIKARGNQRVAPLTSRRQAQLQGEDDRAKLDRSFRR